MKFSLTIEAVDKASKAIAGVAKATKSANDASIKGADKAAKATEKVAKAQSQNAQAAAKAAQATKQAAQASKANTDNSIKQTAALEKEAQAWANLQRKRIDWSSKKVANGIENIANGGLGVMKYGVKLAGGALALGGIGFGLGLAGSKKAREYQQLQIQMQGVTASAEEAAKAMEWVEKANMPGQGVDALTQAFIQVKSAGIDPTKGALQGLADMATTSNKGMEQAAKAYTDALRGELGGLKEFGIEAKKNGKYIEYMYAGKDGRMKRYKAAAGSRGDNAAALQKVMGARFGGSSNAFGKTWDGMIWKLYNTWDKVQLKIMNAGVFDFLTGKLDAVVGLIDKWAADGSLDKWCKQISDGLTQAMTIGWAVAETLWTAGEKIFHVLDGISGYVGGWENLALILIALPVAPSLFKIATGFFQVAQCLGGLLRFGGSAIGMFAKINGFTKIGAALRLLVAPIGLVTKGFISMGIAFMTTPIGWVVAGIAAIAGGAYLVYRNWDKIGPWFKNLWAKTKQIFSNFWAWVKGLFTWDNVFTAINWFSYLVPIHWVEFIPGFPGWQTVISVFSWDTVIKALSWSKYIVNWVWNNVLTRIDWGFWINPFEWAKMIPGFPGWDAIIQSDTVQSVMDTVVGVFEKSKEKIGNVFQSIGKAWQWVKGLFSGGDNAAAITVAQDPAAISAANAEVEKLSGKLEALSAIDFSNTNAALTGLQDKTAETIAKAGGIERAFSVAISAARSVLAATSFESHGVALMRTFAQGIRNGAGAAIAATSDVVGQIRDYLPHSPAKRGPLSDLDKVRFSETLATAMRPAPAVKAAERVAAGVRSVLSEAVTLPQKSAIFTGTAPTALVSARVSKPASEGLPAGHNNGGNGGGSVVLNFSPQISIQGDADRGMLDKLMRETLAQLEGKLPKLMDKVAAAKARKEY
ncbi:hypothetical protein H3V13_00715 [Bartonella sp. M0280]|uniref:hypothetical protein n=1 Tax=Bartonella apihabitans TaxID=2750929 RepID=UPI0018DCB4E8|nr:hypothetical protein [Bartonella apihabitans]MBI0166483.1 hypothetical protein [Bartonella apihabitans]